MHRLMHGRFLSALLGYTGAACILAITAGTAQAYARQDAEFDFGFLASRHVLQDGSVRTRILGPLWEHRQEQAAKTNTTFGALRPFYSFQKGPGPDRAFYDYVWPLGVRRDIENKTSARILLAHFMNADRENPDSSWRFWLLPLYFQGTSDKGVDYLALFPLGGTIRGIFLQDRVSFCLFPLRWTTSLNDIEGGGWLWPIFAKSSGEDIERFRVFPFYGQSSLRDDFKKKYILWPFYTEARYGPNYGNGKAWILFPLTGHIKLDDQEGFWVLPPLFRFHRGEKQSTYYVPWPFIQIGHGEIDKFYVWPLFGTRKIDNHTKTFYLWPFINHRHMEDPLRDVNRWTAWPFWYSDTLTREKPKPSVEYTYRKFWPLFSYKAQEDERRFRMLDLWPARDHEAVDRNWSPLWTLFESNARGPERETEFLWGLFRKHSIQNEYRYWSLFPFFDSKRYLEEKDSEWNLLKGLIGREREANKTRWKFLYFIRWESENR